MPGRPCRARSTVPIETSAISAISWIPRLFFFILQPSSVVAPKHFSATRKSRFPENLVAVAVDILRPAVEERVSVVRESWHRQITVPLFARANNAYFRLLLKPDARLLQFFRIECCA